MLIAKKRANGEGSIWKRHDGRWECAMVVGTDPSGKKIRKTALAKTHKEIIIKMNDLRRQYFGTVLVSDENLTITEWLEKWLNEYKKPFIREGTYIGYMNAMKHINEHIGKKQLNRIKTEDIQVFYNKLVENGRKNQSKDGVKGLSANYVRKIHIVLQEALEYAVNERIIPSNPAKSTILPRIIKKEKKVMVEKEVEKFIEAIDKLPEWKDLFYLELMTGLRRGEICGLMWDDFDEKNGTLTVQRTVTYRNGELKIGEPKTEDGKRVIILPGSALEMLTERKNEAIGKWVFPKPLNPEYPISPNHAYQKLQDILKDAGLERMRFHDLRHTFATHAARNGVDPKTLAGLLGHTNASFTLDTYTHVTSDMQKTAANVVERFVDDLLSDELGLKIELI